MPDSVPPSMNHDLDRMLLTQEQIQVPADLSVFAGHFPENPIVPGIYSLELAGRCIASRLGVTAALRQISKCKFHKPLRPGMCLVAEIKIGEVANGRWQAKVVLVDNRDQSPAVEITCSGAM